MGNRKEEKFKELERQIFKKNKTAAIVFSIIVTGTLLAFFSYVSIKPWEILYYGYTYWGFIFLTLFGVVLIPCSFSRYFFKRYCHKIKSMEDEMQEFVAEEHKQERNNEIQNIIEIIGSVGGFILCIIFSVLYFVSPALFLHN